MSSKADASNSFSLPYPLGELSIHHEVVHVLLRARQLQFPRDDGHQERRASRSLKDRRSQRDWGGQSEREGGGEETDSGDASGRVGNVLRPPL